MWDFAATAHVHFARYHPGLIGGEQGDSFGVCREEVANNGGGWRRGVWWRWGDPHETQTSLREGREQPHAGGAGELAGVSIEQSLSESRGYVFGAFTRCF